jgi:hypothetical protein
MGVKSLGKGTMVSYSILHGTESFFRNQMSVIYEGESNENLKSATKILNTARLSFKLTTVILMV